MSLPTLIYIEVGSIQLDPVRNAVILKAHWLPPPNPFPAGKIDTYINFQPNPFQVTSSQAKLTTTAIGTQIESFFDQFTYKMHVEPDPYDSSKEAYILELFTV